MMAENDTDAGSLVLLTGSLVRQLYNELKDAVADKWYLIGVQLGIPVPKLNGIQKKNNDDVSRCLIELLQYWIDSSNPAKPWDDVIAALCKVDNNKLADELKSKYCKPASAADSKVMEGAACDEVRHSVVVPKKEVVHSLMDLENDFTYMILDVGKIGKQSEIDISEVKRMYKIRFQSDEFKDCDSCQDVLDQLSTGNHISTFNIKALELLRRQIPPGNEMMLIMELYEKKKDKFLNSTLVADFQCVVTQPKLDDPKMAKVVVRIPNYAAKKRTLKDIETLAKEAFVDCFELFVHLQVEPGSVCIIWWYPDRLTAVLKKSVRTALLIEEGVEEMCIAGETIVHSEKITDLVHHGPVKMLIRPGVSEDQLICLLKGYANMLTVLQTSNLPDNKFLNLIYFLSNFCDEESIQQCSTVCNVINLLKEQLKIYPFNIDALNVSCKYFCSSEVTDSLQQYKQQLDEFLSNTSVKDLKDSLKTHLLDSSQVEFVTLKLNESWMENTIKALKRLAHHLVGNCSKALVPSHTCLGCVCVTWIVPISMVPNLRAIVKAKQLSPEYLMHKGVLEFVIGLRIAPNEAVLSGQLTGALASASDSHTKLDSEEHDMIQKIKRVRGQINLDMEKTQNQNEKLESEVQLRAIQKEKLELEKNHKELKLKYLHLEEKCKELESDVEMFEQKSTIPKPPVSDVGIQVTSHSSINGKEKGDQDNSSPAKKPSAFFHTDTTSEGMGGDLMVTVGDETFNILEEPKSDSALVKEHEDLILAGTDLNSLVTDLSMVGKFTRIAYNGVAGCTDLQIKVRHIMVTLTMFCDKLASLYMLQKSRTVLLMNLKKISYQLLIDGMEDIAMVTLQPTATVAQEMAHATEQLARAFEEESERVEKALEDTCTMSTKETEEKRIEERTHKIEHAEAAQKQSAAVGQNLDQQYYSRETAISSLHKAMGGLNGLSNVMRKISLFLKNLESECDELGNQEVIVMIKAAMKIPKEKRAAIWGSTGFKTKTILYYARWVALGNICGTYYERIKVTQKELYGYLEENLTMEEARRNIQQLAATFSKELEEEQRVIAEKETQGQREMIALTTCTSEETFTGKQLTVRQIINSDYVSIHRAMSLSTSNMARHLYAAHFIGDSTHRHVTTTVSIPEDAKAEKLLQDCKENIITHAQPVERMRELLEILCEEPSARAVADKINKQLSTLLQTE